MVLESTCRCTNDYYCFICSWAGKFSVVVGVVLKSWDTYCVELNNLRVILVRSHSHTYLPTTTWWWEMKTKGSPVTARKARAIWPDCSYALAPKDS